jgi:hypothetical protein
LVAEGTPLPVGRAALGLLGFLALFLGFLALFLGFLAFFLALCFLCFCCFAPCEDCCSPVLVPAGSGVLDVVVVVVVVVLVLDEDDEGGAPFFGGEVEVEVEPVEAGAVEDVEDVGAAEVVVVVVVVVAPTVGVVVVDGAHFLCLETITPLVGSLIAEMGVPGATLTWKT